MISVVAICKNEEKNVKGFLASWSEVAGEIVLVDTGSTDGTADAISLAAEAKRPSCGIALHHFDWDGDFSNARNFAIARSTGSFVIWADLDDRVDLTSISAIKKIADRREPQLFPAYRFQVCSDMGDGAWHRFMQTRAFFRNNEIRFTGKVHESLDKSLADLDLKVAQRPEIIIAHLGYRTAAVRREKAERNLGLLLEGGSSRVVGDKDACCQVGDALFVLDRFGEGLAFYKNACRNWPELRPLLAEKMGYGFIRDRNLRACETCLHDVSADSPGYSYLRGAICMARGDKRGAADYFRMALDGGGSLHLRECNGDMYKRMSRRCLSAIEDKEAVCSLS